MNICKSGWCTCLKNIVQSVGYVGGCCVGVLFCDVVKILEDMV
jgi:hypothetical protein